MLSQRTLRLIFAVLVVAGLAGIVLTEIYVSRLAELSERSPDEAAQRIAWGLRAISLFLAATTVVAAASLAWFSWRLIQTAGVAPDPNILHETTGSPKKRAVARGRLGLLISLLVAALGVSASVVLWNLVGRIMGE